METSAAKSIKMWTFLRMCESGGKIQATLGHWPICFHTGFLKKCIFCGEYVYFW